MADQVKRTKEERRKVGLSTEDVIATRLEAVLHAAVSEDAARLARSPAWRGRGSPA